MNPIAMALMKKKLDASYEEKAMVELPTSELGPIKPGDKIIATVAFTVKSMNDAGRALLCIDMVSRNGYEEIENEPIYVKTQESHG